MRPSLVFARTMSLMVLVWMLHVGVEHIAGLTAHVGHPLQDLHKVRTTHKVVTNSLRQWTCKPWLQRLYRPCFLIKLSSSLLSLTVWKAFHVCIVHASLRLNPEPCFVTNSIFNSCMQVKESLVSSVRPGKALVQVPSKQLTSNAL